MRPSKLLAALGAAFYAEQRSGGSRADVDTALKAVDQFVTENGTDGFPGAEEERSRSPAADAGTDASPSPPPPPAAPSAPPADPPAAGGSAYDVPPRQLAA